MRTIAALSLAALLVLASGCFQARYTNLNGPNQPPASAPAKTSKSASHGWRHFFFFGLAPDVIRIDAAEQCGGKQHIAAIETKQTFLQGLVEELATYYVNIYSPWTGRVVCDSDVESASE